MTDRYIRTNVVAAAIVVFIFACIVCGDCTAQPAAPSGKADAEGVITVIGKGAQHNIDKVRSARGSFVVQMERNGKRPGDAPQPVNTKHYAWAFCESSFFESRSWIEDGALQALVVAMDARHSYIYQPLLKHGAVMARDDRVVASEVGVKLGVAGKFMRDFSLPLDLFRLYGASQVTREEVDGISCYRVEALAGKGGHNTWWLDPTKGFMVVRRLRQSEVVDGNATRRSESDFVASNWVQYDGGIWLPSKTTATTYTVADSGERTWVTRDTFIVVVLQVNCMVPEADLRVEFPPNVDVNRE